MATSGDYGICFEGSGRKPRANIDPNGSHSHQGSTFGPKRGPAPLVSSDGQQDHNVSELLKLIRDQKKTMQAQKLAVLETQRTAKGDIALVEELAAERHKVRPKPRPSCPRNTA